MFGVETAIGLVRQIPVRGKGRLFDALAPRSGVRVVPVWGHYRMHLDLADVVQRQIFLGCFGFEIAAAVRALVPDGGRFLDVGAHAGYFTLLAAHRAGPTGRVFAVEPNPTMFARLAAMLRENGVATVRAEAVALSDELGELTLYVPPDTENRPHNVTALPQPGWEPVTVPCRRLADCLREWAATPIDLMKMDVEGFEPQVLAGSGEALANGGVRHVITEVNGLRLTQNGSSPTALVKQLGDLGFLPAALAGRRAVPVSVHSWDFDPTHEYDRLFVHHTAVGR
jgi:FkbM family methyltransferase